MMPAAVERRLGVIAIVLDDRNHAACRVDKVLADYSHIVMTRTFLPFSGKGVISLIIEASTDEVGALTGRLGMLRNVKVKSVLM